MPKAPIRPITQPRLAKWNQSYLWDGTDARFVTRLFAYVSPVSQLFDRFSNGMAFQSGSGEAGSKFEHARLQLMIQPSVVTYSPELQMEALQRSRAVPQPVAVLEHPGQ